MKKIFRLLSFVLFCSLLAARPAVAGEFSVTPIRLDLGAAIRSSVISIRNDDTQKLIFQLQAMEWSQDSAGKDQYAVSQDLIFFPKILSVEPSEEGLIRVGTKTPEVPTEKTYRLFIEELPSPSKSTTGNSAQINVLIRFGAPVFISPLKPLDNLDIEDFQIDQGIVSLSVKNTGNRHQFVQGINLRGVDRTGNEVYGLTLTDRYLLTGTAKSYTATIPPGQCGRMTSLAVEFKTDKFVATRKLDISRSMCP